MAPLPQCVRGAIEAIAAIIAPQILSGVDTRPCGRVTRSRGPWPQQGRGNGNGKEIGPAPPTASVSAGVSSRMTGVARTTWVGSRAVVFNILPLRCWTVILPDDHPTFLPPVLIDGKLRRLKRQIRRSQRCYYLVQGLISQNFLYFSSVSAANVTHRQLAQRSVPSAAARCRPWRARRGAPSRALSVIGARRQPMLHP